MPEDLRRSAARSLLGTVPIVMRAMGRGIREAGCEAKPHQVRLMMMIAAKPRTLSDIARIQGVTPATATTIVTTLENHGWVARAHDPVDRRRVVVSLTEEGSSALKASQDIAERSIAEMLAPLSDEALQRLASAVEVLRELGAGSVHR